MKQGEENVALLWAEEGFPQPEMRPSRSGVPILFPFPGRVRGRSMTYRGRIYSLEQEDENGGNAIHGLVHQRAWRTKNSTPSHLTAEFQASVDAPEILTDERWPADFRLTATFDAEEDGLAMTLTVENGSENTLPCGWGLHPYFRVPLSDDARTESRENCVVRVPVGSAWEMVDMIATGKSSSDDPDVAKLAGGAPVRRDELRPRLRRPDVRRRYLRSGDR